MDQTEIRNAHLIPITDTANGWRQTREIPVVKQIRQGGPYSSDTIYLTYPACLQQYTPEERKTLEVKAGGCESIEIVDERIRVQIIHRLEFALAALQTANPHPTASLEAEQYGQLFQPKVTTTIMPKMI